MKNFGILSFSCLIFLHFCGLESPPSSSSKNVFLDTPFWNTQEKAVDVDDFDMIHLSILSILVLSEAYPIHPVFSSTDNTKSSAPTVVQNVLRCEESAPENIDGQFMNIYQDQWDGLYQVLKLADGVDINKTTSTDYPQLLRTGQAFPESSFQYSWKNKWAFPNSMTQNICASERASLLKFDLAVLNPSVFFQDERITFNRVLEENDNVKKWELETQIAQSASYKWTLTSIHRVFQQQRQGTISLLMKASHKDTKSLLGIFSFMMHWNKSQFILKLPLKVEGSPLPLQAELEWPSPIVFHVAKEKGTEPLIFELPPPEKPLLFDFEKGCWPINGQVIWNVKEGRPNFKRSYTMTFKEGEGIWSIGNMTLNLNLSRLNCLRNKSVHNMLISSISR